MFDEGIFTQNILHCIITGESTLSKTESSFISVKRSHGTFGSVTVMWDVVPSDQPDLTPMSGAITYGDGQSQGVIQIKTVADNVSKSSLKKSKAQCSFQTILCH